MIATLEEELELLSRMSAQHLDYDLMRSLSDVPDSLLGAFRATYTPEKAELLLTQIRESRAISGLDAIRQHLLEALVRFDVPADVAAAYIAGVVEH